MGYMIQGQDIRNIAEVAASGDPRNGTAFCTSNYLYNGQTYTAGTGQKFITIPSSYWYANQIGLYTRYLKNGSPMWTISRRGWRPRSTYRYGSSTSFYINKFSDCEVWISSSDNSRSGTRISTTDQDFNCLFFCLCGGGGGGGGSSGTASAGGGGGAAYVYSAVKLYANYKVQFIIGGGGGGGGNNAGGGSGGTSQAIVFTDKSHTTGSHYLIAYGGGAGENGSSGSAGSGGHTSGTNENPYFYTVKSTNGAAGGSRNNAGGYCTVNFNNYTPEAEQITYMTGGGGASGGGSGGGGGGASPLGFGGDGGGGAGGVGSTGSGGGGGQFKLFSYNSGGSGGSGTCSLYY